jgi:predicted metal-dependent HD superfamily phosphohydrolase
VTKAVYPGSFLERDRTYFTDIFRDKYEIEARKNLKRWLERK